MVLAYGTICLDKVRRLPSLPPKGSYVEVEGEEQVFLGGEAVNTALALHAWGVGVRLAGNPLGRDEDARILREMLNLRGISTDLIQTAGARTPACDIYVTPDGDRTMFGLGFTNMATFAEPSSVSYRPGEWFTVDSNLGPKAREAAERAAAAGMRVYVMDFSLSGDPVPEGSFWQSSTDWVGYEGDSVRNVEWVSRQVDAHGCVAILSDGARGVVMGSPSLRARVYPPFPCPHLVDTTGAGDMLRAGMLLGLGREWPVPRCLAFGSAAAALKCQYLGANVRVPTEAEVEEHIARHTDVFAQYA